jgi:hypothetical protein
LARESPGWGHNRSFSQSYGNKTPAHQRSRTVGAEECGGSMFLSPTLEEGSMLKTPIVGGPGGFSLSAPSPSVCEMLSPPEGVFSARHAASPSVCEMLSPPLFGMDAEITLAGPDLEDGAMDVARDIVIRMTKVCPLRTTILSTLLLRKRVLLQRRRES